MATLRLLNITPDVARLSKDPAAFERTHSAGFGPLASMIQDVIAMNETHRAKTGAPPVWGAYLAIDLETRLVIGACAYKGAPVDGAVEIAYYTLPPYENKGFASQMAGELTKLAFIEPGVRKVLAHTLPEDSASTSVLGKNGFVRVGEVMDPDDGRVWRWEKNR